MARALGEVVENNFVKGVVTEFSGFNFPENSCLDADNTVFTEKGEAYRRLGFALEENYEVKTIVTSSLSANCAYSLYQWRNAGIQSDTSFVVSQIGNSLYFYKILGSSISPNEEAFTVNLEDYKTNPSFVTGESRCQFASGGGQLFIVNPRTHPLRIVYNETLNTITVTPIEVKTRDFSIQFGTPAIQPQDQPTFFQSEHIYNLLNQGWTQEYITNFAAQMPGYPSLSKLVWNYRVASGSLAGAIIFANNNTVSVTGNTYAPRGSIILSEFNKDRNAASNGFVSGIPVETSNGERPSCLTFLNGRLFLSGVNAPKYLGKIYFSKIIKEIQNEIKFYQEGDPSSELNPQLLPNDGGVITIQEAGRIVALYPVKNTLLVFATNGVWSIAGSEGVGFTATDFSIEKLSNTGITNLSALTFVENVPIFWNSDGIYLVKGNPLGSLDVVSVTKESIQTLYDEIPVVCKERAKAAYNQLTKEIYWLYSEDTDNPDDYSRILVLRANTQAFYPFSFNNSTVKIKDIISLGGSFVNSYEDPVTTTSGTIVTNNALVSLTSELKSQGAATSTSKFLVAWPGTSGNTNYSFAELSDSSLLDWSAISSSPYTSYFVPGYRLRGAGHREFTQHYITVFAKQQVNSSCLMSTIWDYANTNTTGLYSNKQQAIAPNTTRDYLTRRLRIRGSGVSVRYYFESEGNKPFNIVGWSTFESVNERV